ncbi:MAG: thioredoxin [Alphaproteobacteria bacterium]|nr:MAG: thioredoxin [Alphaproteobacteria bacterium]
MQKKTMFKTLSIFTLALFVMSLSGAAATSAPCKAYPDKFSFSPSKYSGNVLSNDKGSGIKVVGTSKTTNSGKVTMKSNGLFSYKPASSSKTTIQDSFTYTIAEKYGKKSTSRVIVNYKTAQETTGVVEVTQLAQINTSLKKGPVFLSLVTKTCPHCKALAPTLKQLEKEYVGKATFLSVDIKKSPKLKAYFGVGGVPDCCVIVGTKNGKYVYMQQNGKTNTVRSKARIFDDRSKSVYEKVLNYATN